MEFESDFLLSAETKADVLYNRRARITFIYKFAEEIAESITLALAEKKWVSAHHSQSA